MALIAYLPEYKIASPHEQIMEVLVPYCGPAAGFLFGFDTVVISGANTPLFKELWPSSAWFRGVFIMSMALWGTVLGSLAAGIPTKRIGRKKTLIWVGAPIW